tara:strand:+ start:188 stop:580 length:393 start_codon:yes stop_codon:yes gene_type:complete
MKKKEKSSHFYQLDRNMDNAKQSNTADINPKMLLSKEDLIDQYDAEEPIVEHDGMRYNPITLEDKRIPEYYRGKEGYEARKVCDNFDLTYHLATATTYILRAYRKHDTPVDCITKAIAHLEFELEKINQK